MDFGVFNKRGVRENVPSILLDDAFLTTGSKNVHRRFGEYRAMRGRLPYLTDDDSEQIGAPKYVYAITAVSTGSKKFTISGNHAATITASANSSQIRINGSTGNDALYTILSVDDVGANTEIVVAEAVPDGTVDGNVHVGITPVLAYHRHVKEKTNAEYWLLASAYHILLWTPSDKSLAVKFTCSAPSSVERWELVTHLDNVYATNNVDKIQWWNVEGSPSNNFAILSNASGLDIDGGTTFITKAKYLASFETYLFVGYVTDSNADVHPHRAIWSSRGTSGATIDFQYDGGTGDAGKKDFSSTPDFLVGFAKSGDYLIVAKQQTMHRGWLTTEDTVFEWVEETLKVGCLSGKTLVNDRAGRLYWLASDLTIRELNTPNPVAWPLEVTTRGINTSVAEFSQATFIDQYAELWFAVPTGDSSTNNIILVINTEDYSCYIHEIPVRAFGDYTAQEVYTYDTLPYETYEAWGLSWVIYDTDVNVLGFPLDMCSDYSGYTYQLHSSDKDAGNDLERVMVFTTTLATGKATLNRFKRINNGIDFYFNRAASGSITAEAKRDNEASWQSVGTASLAGTANIVVPHVPSDIRARSFDFKLSSTDYFEFIGMGFSDFEVEETR